MGKDVTYPLVPVFSLLSFIFISAPFVERGFRRTLNSGVAVFAIWVLGVAVKTGIEAIVWSGRTNDFAPAWCDISSRVYIAANVSFPACPLLIMRRLRHTLSPEIRSVVKAHSKMRRLLPEIVFGLVFPAVIADYVVQGRRYAIVEDFGCEPVPSTTGVSVLLLDSLPVFLPSIAVSYLVRSLWLRHPKPFEQRHHVDPFAYRNLFMACAVIAVILPIAITGLIFDIRTPDMPFWPGWATVHGNERSVIVPAIEWMRSRWDRFGVHISQWINAVFAACFFANYATTSHMCKLYKRICRKMRDWGEAAKTAPRCEKLPMTADTEYVLSVNFCYMADFSPRTRAQLASLQYATSCQSADTTLSSTGSTQHPVVYFDETSIELDSVISLCVTPPSAVLSRNSIHL
ncbi:pheromone A receptor-domain-containing protein [Vararia minispora EC-137]|uniref:Pheromone A receptor-domain-containing protein n=1 Tax=Vararia minispora EC-137 TaxID=1314806 RepID=A0ACB8QBN7_9AGAM|nr:pheromone A receptor-domain-containing protein [Vararia minispora EC-137]